VTARAAVLVATLLVASTAGAQAEAKPTPQRVHCVCDISQEFTFYMDGRFFRQYLEGHGEDARNWGSLAELDLANTNLLVLAGGDRRLPYSDASLRTVDAFLAGGGAVLVLLDGKDSPGNAILRRHGAASTDVDAGTKPHSTKTLQVLVGANNVAIENRPGNLLEVDLEWSGLVTDQGGRPLLAQRAVGKGRLLASSRGLFGSNPDASDPINAAWITPLLLHATQSKSVDAKRAHSSTWAEDTQQLGPLTLEYHDGTAPFAAAIAKEYELVRPHLVAITGVEPAAGMIKKLLVLPTGGGGFSSGERIAIGAWWGDYPSNRYAMIELIGHEAGHSWVLPYPEPLWNEPIATYLGIQVGLRLGMKEAQETLDRQIKQARRHDPKFDRQNALADDAHRDLVWGKSYFVFDELERRHGPGALAKYFRTKREVLQPGRDSYSFDDLVAVWSRAVDKDLFPWFQSLAFDVKPERTNVPLTR
jgi:hypothetical protein